MAVETKDDLLRIVRDHQQEIRSLGVRRLGLFGSFARGQAGPESDVDMLVEFEPGMKTFDAFIQLAFALEDLFGRAVELMTPEALSPYIGPHILREVEYVAFTA